MAKLTGQKKLEFLKRMAKGRKKASRGNPKRKTAAKKRNAAPKRKPAAKKKRNAARGKLTGAKKAEFLRRMARGRKKATRGNPKRKTAAKKRNAPKRTAKKNTTGAAISTEKRGTGANTYYLVKVGASVVGQHQTKAAAAKQVKYLKRSRESFAKRNPPNKKSTRRKTRRRNSEAGAAEMYQTFHGKAPARTLTYEEEINYHGNYAELGKLIELQIDLDAANRKYPFTEFGNCLVVCTTDGENIYFVGGDQRVDLANLDIGGAKDLVELGPCGYIAYRTEKHQFHDFAPRTYYHHFGEENGVKPTLCYDRLNRKLYFSGGDYHVKREGITN